MTRDDHQRLPEALAKQVLARAAQLDESQRTTLSVPELRTAAIEAGISASAVDQALKEIANTQGAAIEQAAAHPGHRRPTNRWKVAVIAIVIALGVILIPRIFVEVAPTAPGTPQTPPTTQTPR